MRGRKPDEVDVVAADLPVLEQVARSRVLPWLQVQRARVLLGMAAGGRTGVVASGAGCDRTTVWRVCRLYEAGGLAAALSDAPRPGCPRRISPLAAGPGRPPRLPGARRPGAAPHPLVER